MPRPPYPGRPVYCLILMCFEDRAGFFSYKLKVCGNSVSTIFPNCLFTSRLSPFGNSCYFQTFSLLLVFAVVIFVVAIQKTDDSLKVPMMVSIF